MQVAATVRLRPVLPWPCTTHPGDILKRQCLEPMGLTVTQAAQKLDVSPEALLELINAGWDLHGDGQAASGGVRLDNGNLAWDAEGL